MKKRGQAPRGARFPGFGSLTCSEPVRVFPSGRQYTPAAGLYPELVALPQIGLGPRGIPQFLVNLTAVVIDDGQFLVVDASCAGQHPLVPRVAGKQKAWQRRTLVRDCQGPVQVVSRALVVSLEKVDVSARIQVAGIFPLLVDRAVDVVQRRVEFQAGDGTRVGAGVE